MNAFALRVPPGEQGLGSRPSTGSTLLCDHREVLISLWARFPFCTMKQLGLMVSRSSQSSDSDHPFPKPMEFWEKQEGHPSC